MIFFFFQAEDGIRDGHVTGVQTCALPILFYGTTLGPWEDIHAAKIYYRQIDVRGSTMGSPEDFARMLEFVTTHQIHPHIDEVFDLKNINAAFERLNHPDSFGKRSEEHTSELQSRGHLVCRLLLEKK